MPRMPKRRKKNKVKFNKKTKTFSLGPIPEGRGELYVKFLIFSHENDLVYEMTTGGNEIYEPDFRAIGQIAMRIEKELEDTIPAFHTMTCERMWDFKNGFYTMVLFDCDAPGELGKRIIDAIAKEGVLPEFLDEPSPRYLALVKAAKGTQS
jgi:hypothetical protein